jgi:hypothetical protein
MWMPKLFKRVNCPANFFSAFDKPCIPLKTSMTILFMSRNGHDKNMTKMCGNGLMFWVKEWTFIPIILAAVVHYGLVIESIKLAVVTLVPIDKRNIA